MWTEIRTEAESWVEKEELMRPLLHSSVLSQRSLEQSVAFQLAAKLARPGCAAATQWHPVFASVLESMGSYRGAPLGALMRDDLSAVVARDPACEHKLHALLFFKGFLGIQAQRIMHFLWADGRRPLACLIQSRVSEVFGMDLHPGARLGGGLMIDHATGIVVGETSVLGDNCTLYHGVTLGGTGKMSGDRHPKLGDGVVVGCNATILGSINVGDSTLVAGGALVLKDVPARVTVAGCPAVIVADRRREGGAATS